MTSREWGDLRPGDLIGVTGGHIGTVVETRSGGSQGNGHVFILMPQLGLVKCSLTLPDAAGTFSVVTAWHGNGDVTLWLLEKIKRLVRCSP